MKQRTINIAGAGAVPLLMAALAMASTALGDYGDRRASDAIVERRLARIELAAREHAASARRIEETVTQMRVDQALFVGGVKARVTALELRVKSP